MNRDSAKAYVDLFEHLSEETIADMDAFVSPNIHFRDPFNDLAGIDRFRALLQKTLRDVNNPRFTVTHQAWDGDVLFLRWIFNGRVGRLGDWSVTGMSELRFDDRGRVREHIDHWDAGEQFYELLPVVGPILRAIKRRMRDS